MILVAFRHGLRVAELVALRRDQVDLKQGEMHVVRRKRGKPSTHPLDAAEIRALGKLLRPAPESPFVFVAEGGGPLTDSTVRKIVARAGVAAGLDISVHPHMLRHACGYALANRGVDTRRIQEYLGHRNIVHTVRYTELSSRRLRDIWRD